MLSPISRPIRLMMANTLLLGLDTERTVSPNPATDKDHPTRKALRASIKLLGHFGGGNFGNDSAFEAMLCHIRRVLPGVEVSCITTVPEKIRTDYDIPAIPINAVIASRWIPNNYFLRLVRKALIGVPSEFYRWINAAIVLRDTDMLVIVGTGLLNDAFGLTSWGPYNILRWSLAAKALRCKVLFVSVGAGPLYTHIGKWLVKSSLTLADYRSYRDHETKNYLGSMGVDVIADAVYPDLAFSICGAKRTQPTKRDRRVVGLGLMTYHERLSSDVPGNSTYEQYLEQLTIFVQWLLKEEYDVRLLTGDMADRTAVETFMSLLKNRLDPWMMPRVFDDPIDSFGSLLAQMDKTDIVVATRFHNVLWALALDKSVISIAFHQKCTSLMASMGLQEYCHDIRGLDADRLIEQFRDL